MCRRAAAVYARGAVGRAAPHCAVVFNSCLTTRLGAGVRTPGTRQEAEAGSRGRKQRQEAEAEGRKQKFSKKV